MKYAIRYYQGCTVLQHADEIILNYHERNINIIDYVGNYPTQRVILNCVDIDDIQDSMNIFKALKEVKKNIALKIKRDTIREEELAELADCGIDFFYAEGAETWDQVEGYISRGVSDIYITSDLGFQLDKVSKLCHKNNVKVRVYPNVAQSSAKIGRVDPFRKFFIRPNDLALVDKWVDVYEFYGPYDRQDVLFNIYKSEKWFGKLEEIILDFNDSVDNRGILPNLMSARFTCGKRCRWTTCNLCAEGKKLSRIIIDNDKQITTGRNKL